MRSLTSLNLGSCYKLEALPAGLYAFPPACCSHHRSLHPPFTLNHTCTTNPNHLLSEGFRYLRSLQTLTLSYCYALESLPVGLRVIDHTCFSPISTSTFHPEPPSNPRG